jgi:hypothetical protein
MEMIPHNFFFLLSIQKLNLSPLFYKFNTIHTIIF